MKITLRERDLDTVFVEAIPDLEQHVADHVCTPVRRVIDPDSQLQVERAVAEPEQLAARLRFQLYARDHFRRFDAQPDGGAGVRVVRDADRNAQSNQVVAVRPVLHPLCDQFLVRDQVFDAISGDYRGITCAEVVYPAERVADGDYVAGLDRAIHQEDHAAEQVGEDLLQAEAETDAECTAEHGQCGQIDAHRR